MGTKEQRQSGSAGGVGPSDDGSALALQSGRGRWPLVEEEIEADGLAQMRHEIRTLLSGIIGISRLLIDTKLDAEPRDYARRIRSSRGDREPARRCHGR